jgi:NAD(P)H dehydrogenase (quinone)
MQCAVIYYSVSGHTKKMAEAIVRGMMQEGLEAKAFSVDDLDLDYVKHSQGFVLGTPVYGGGPAAKFYAFLEKLDRLSPAGKLGGAFATEDYIHGGATNTIIDIMRHELVSGMMVYSSGHACGKPFIHYGPCATASNIDEFTSLFEVYGARFGAQVKKINQ